VANGRAGPFAQLLGGTARLDIARNGAVRQKLVEPGMRSHYFIAGGRQGVRGILNPLDAVGLRQSAGNIRHNRTQFFRYCICVRRGRQDFPMKRRANFPSRSQLPKLALRFAGALFTVRDAIHGKLGFGLTRRADFHGYVDRRSGLFVPFKRLNVNILFHLKSCNLYCNSADFRVCGVRRSALHFPSRLGPAAFQQAVPRIL
jgi:hypothetical protein